MASCIKDFGPDHAWIGFAHSLVVYVGFGQPRGLAEEFIHLFILVCIYYIIVTCDYFLGI